MSMIHEITSAAPRNKKSQRKGRGESSGRGKTCGRGTKGSGAHGGDVHWIPGREGGQTPVFRRFPKRGFSNYQFERRFHIVNLADLDQFDAGATVDASALKEKGLVPDLKQPVKILAGGGGKLSKKLTIVAGWYSKSAHAAITSAGGTAQNLKGEAFEFPKPKKKFVPREGAGKKKKKVEEEAPAAAPEGGAAPAPAPAAEKKEEAPPKTEGASE
jgi:large subunit ribosomal protein L15